MYWFVTPILHSQLDFIRAVIFLYPSVGKRNWCSTTRSALVLTGIQQSTEEIQILCCLAWGWFFFDITLLISLLGQKLTCVVELQKLMCAYVCGCIFTCMHAYVCVFVCLHVCMHVHMDACVHASMHVCMHVCIYVCMYIGIYICIYTCKFLFINRSI